VLIESGGREALTAMLPCELDRGDVGIRWLASPAVQRFERGLMAPEDFGRALVDEWGLDMEPAEFIASFATWPGGFYPGARELLARLRPHHRVACLSNSNAIHWERFSGLEDVFHASFSSHQIGCVKPDREAFEHVLKKLEVEPADVYFFDDLAPNVEAAKAIGLNAFQVDGLAPIEPILRREGLCG
jgi:putative hydrolase of the HAD superfamily